MIHRLRCRRHCVQIVQRLPHAHENNVGDRHRVPLARLRSP
jgi:hypothetical protein